MKYLWALKLLFTNIRMFRAFVKGEFLSCRSRLSHKAFLKTLRSNGIECPRVVNLVKE